MLTETVVRPPQRLRSTSSARRPLARLPLAPLQHGSTRVQLFALLGFYLAMLAWIVLWKLQVPFIGTGGWRPVKLVPFVRWHGLGANAPSEVLGNLLLFVPLGVYCELLSRKYRWWAPLLAGGLLSLGFEMTQLLLAIGSFDVTDLIMNTAGVGVGLLGTRFVTSRWPFEVAAAAPRVCIAASWFLALLIAWVVVS